MKEPNKSTYGNRDITQTPINWKCTAFRSPNRIKKRKMSHRIHTNAICAQQMCLIHKRHGIDDEIELDVREIVSFNLCDVRFVDWENRNEINCDKIDATRVLLLHRNHANHSNFSFWSISNVTFELRTLYFQHLFLQPLWLRYEICQIWCWMHWSDFMAIVTFALYANEKIPSWK